MRYKFYFEIDIKDMKDCSDEYLQKTFQDVADAIQTVLPFNDEDWNFSCSNSDL